MKRILALGLVFTAVAWMAIAHVDRVTPASATLAPQTQVPRQALDAVESGRYLRASLILREYLRTHRDTTPVTILLAAQAEAGWGDWERVETLLTGRVWLDDVAEGASRSLLGRSQLELGRYEEASRSFGRYLEVAGSAGDRERGLAAARAADALRAIDDHAAARAYYDMAAELLPAAADWLGLDAATAAAALGDTAEVRRRMAALRSDLADDFAWRLPIDARFAAADTVGAGLLAESLAEGDGPASRRAHAWSILGQLRQRAGDHAAARQAFRSAMRIGPSTGAAVDAARALTDMPGQTLDDRLEIGRIYLRHGNIERGEAGIQAYLDAGAGSPAERTRLTHELGRALFRAGRYAEAERALLAVAGQAPQPASAAEALFYAGRAQYRDGREELGRATFLRVAQEYRGQPWATQAMYLSADLDHDDGNLRRAADRYRQTIVLGTDIEEVGLAYMRLAGMAFQDADYETAFDRFQQYRTRYPRGRRYAQATYWAAVAQRRLGDETAARTLLEEVRRSEPFSYYAGRAADLLGQPFWTSPLDPGPPPDGGPSSELTRTLARIDLLRELDRSGAVGHEVTRAARRVAGARSASYALAEALNDRGLTNTAIGMGWDLHRREDRWNARLLRIIYPFPYREIIVEEARERGVDPFLAAGLIRQESMFNARAVSPAGAIGLMQVMPATGRILARDLDVREFTPDLLRSAEFNVALGMRYLADQLTTYDNRLPVVLSAYNAGPTRVTRWRELFPEFDDDELLSERIPFQETREYVKIVQYNRRIYQALYAAAVEGPETGG
jgi:soluble lytic murein transglycosylase